jgi:Phosphoglycerate kinase
LHWSAIYIRTSTGATRTSIDVIDITTVTTSCCLLLLLLLQSMLDKVDKLIIGGGMVFTFLKARGLSVGTSLVEEDQIELAKKVMHITITNYHIL